MERWALVTAGAQGLGQAISRHLIERGYSVIVHHHSSRAGAEALSDAARVAGVSVVPIAADLSTGAGREGLMREVDRTLGSAGLQVFVHNLGVYPLEHLLETSNETFECVFALTCTAVFHLTQLALGRLRAAPKARIITLGDATCDRIEAHDDATPYHIAKLGVHVLTRTYAEQLGPEGITVNMVSPGFLENSVGVPHVPIPLGRKGRFADITGAIDYLLSERADYVSGTNLRVSGAWCL